jgi:hypothetical protein
MQVLVECTAVRTSKATAIVATRARGYAPIVRAMTDECRGAAVAMLRKRGKKALQLTALALVHDVVGEKIAFSNFWFGANFASQLSHTPVCSSASVLPK